MEELAMFNSEMIVGLWFVPVVLFIALPLSMLCIWTIHRVLKRIADKIEQVHGIAKDAHDKGHVAGLHTKSVA